MKIKGSNKADNLVGTADDDTILGLGGDDTIKVKGGSDTVDAGKGDDSVILTAGAESSDIDLGKGNDSVEIKESNQSNQTFTIDGGKGNDAVNFALGQEGYTITEGGDGAYTVVDANGNSYALSSISDLTFNGIAYTPANPTNDAPVVSNPIADQPTTVSTAYTFQVATNAFTDPDGDTLTYTATLADGSALPSWLAFDATTRTFSGTPTNAGAVTVRVTASDGSLTASDDFVIGVTGGGTGGGGGGGGGGGDEVSGLKVDLYDANGDLVDGYATILEAVAAAHEDYRIEVRDTSAAYAGDVTINIAGLRVNGNGAEISGGVSFLGAAEGASLDGFKVNGTLTGAGYENSSVFVLADGVTVSDNQISSNGDVGVVVGIGIEGVTISGNNISGSYFGAYINPTIGAGTTVSGNHFSGNTESLVLEQGVIPVSGNTFDDGGKNDIRISLRTEGTYDVDTLIGSANSFGTETKIEVRLSGNSKITGSDLEELFSIPSSGYQNTTGGPVTLHSSLGGDTYEAARESQVTFELSDTSHSGFGQNVTTFDFSDASGEIPLHIRLSGSDFQGAADLITHYSSVGYFGIGRAASAGVPADDFFILRQGETIAATPGAPTAGIGVGSQSLVVYEDLGGNEYNLYFDADGNGDLNAGDAQIHVIGLDHADVDWTASAMIVV